MIDALVPPYLRRLPDDTRTPCYGHGELMVPDTPHPPATLTDAARALCAACPIQQACADWATSTRQPHGVWGGLTPAERRAVQRPECGTDAGWRSHRARNEGCTTCREAHDERLREGRRARLEQEHREHGGSLAGYRLELLLGLPTCVRCRAVRQEHYASLPRAPKWYRRTAA
ncbi:WhiB family transcriptional regulator [Streptomyces sulphureus]|uniref:WhiB family transcriptional regulator n=1 Tax=Streptomyces sulphureus TaxID=47758 RepID=UPI000377C70E|nr:WhiB family transcriptional regulator [Streptomyces sulphureus]